jgi:ketosteroid isomerase-like protein
VCLLDVSGTIEIEHTAVQSCKMKILLLSFLVICFCAGSNVAQQKPRLNDLKAIVETERAFSRMSEEKGTREAFAEFIANDGILFRPMAVFGKKWMLKHPLPPSSARSLLTWQPGFADVSLAGDLGYTTGPWQFKKDVKDAKPTAFGSFMTVWKREANGMWRFVLDLGISNPDPTTAMYMPYGDITRPKNFKTINRLTARAALLTADREFSKASADQGAREAFLSYAAKDVRLFRNDHFPFVGKMAAADALAPLTAEWTWKPMFADVSSSGDLGYSYGIYELKDKNGAVSESGNYARVWKKVIGTWKLVVDVADPLPPEARKN